MLEKQVIDRAFPPKYYIGGEILDEFNVFKTHSLLLSRVSIGGKGTVRRKKKRIKGGIVTRNRVGQGRFYRGYNARRDMDEEEKQIKC